MKYLILYPENASNYLACTAAKLADKLCKDGFEATCATNLPEAPIKNTAIVNLIVKRGSDAVTFEKVGRDYTLCAPTEALCATFTKELFAAIKSKKLPKRYDVKPYLRNGWGIALPAYEGGVLSDGFTKNGKKAPKYFLLEHLLLNVVSRPDFIAYNHKATPKVSLTLCRKLFNVPVVAWTVKTAEEWSKCADKFDAYICEGLPKKRKVNK